MMERLTGYNSFGGAYGIGMRCRDNADTINAIITRLAHYEDMEEQGRLVVLPVKEGTPVYTTRWWDDVPEVCTDSKGKKFKRVTMRNKVTKERFSPFGLDYTQWGKTVFLTREEAEQALKGGAE